MAHEALPADSAPTPAGVTITGMLVPESPLVV
jgi:hypothetical protein